MPTAAPTYTVARTKGGVPQFAAGYDPHLGYVTGWTRHPKDAAPVPATAMDKVMSHLTPKRPDPNLGEIAVFDADGRSVPLRGPNGAAVRATFAPPPAGLSAPHAELFTLLGMTGDPTAVTPDAVAAVALREIKDLRELMSDPDLQEGTPAAGPLGDPDAPSLPGGPCPPPPAGEVA
jgi:hypothetical protein